jgi:hypothetical protein
MRVLVHMLCDRAHSWRQTGDFVKAPLGGWMPLPHAQFILRCPECGRSAVRTTAYREGSVRDTIKSL